MLITLGNTIGASFLGTVGACILFGISLVQAYIYYTNYPKDWLFQKLVVGLLIILDTCHLACTIHTTYYYTIEQFGNAQALGKIVWSFRVQVIFNVIIVVIVQSLYVHRVWRLGSRFSRIWPAIVIGILIAGSVVGLLLIYHTFKLTGWDDMHSATWVLYATFSTTTAIDVLLAATMCYYLNKSKSGFAKTHSLVVTIMHYVLISGALTSVTSVIALVTFVTMPNNLIFIGITFLVTKLYINSYVAMLNARNNIREDSSISVDIMNLRSGLTKPADTTMGSHSHIHSDDKPHKGESLQLSSMTYRGKDIDEESSDSKGGHVAMPHAGMIGIHVHKTEERRVEGDGGPWSPA
ncbi:hypothetical protein GALMADRAFT_243550 [Galerina marginata CBS 339.88]|uniref:DUF6534 domain-containing protein n=1 Tax=Galerina marginata (strain CBS 339.88) TaxID=685588 RepID=A0A067TAV8_GALM3|nr:hypothetical protein GALMADRAFT_243550 [Galerina marginata CBS 339.88]